MSARIEIGVGPSSGAGPTQFVTAFEGGKVVVPLSGAPEVSFTMPGNSPAAGISDGLATDVWVYKTGALWQRCRMLPLAQSWNEHGDDTVSVRAVGYRRLVEKRHLVTSPAPSFSATDQGAIMWAFIEHTQATAGGDLGITAGTYTTGVLRDRNEYAIGDNLGTLMGNLSDVLDGCWWGIDANLVFTARMWTDFPTRTERITHGSNARSLNRDPTDGFTNAAGALGSTQDTVAHWVEAADVATDPRGRWEAFDSSHGSVTVQGTVNDYAEGLLFTGSYPPSLWTVALDPAAFFEGSSNYEAGDLVTIVVPRSAANEVGVPPVHVIAQVTELSVSFDSNGGHEVQLAASEQGVAA